MSTIAPAPRLETRLHDAARELPSDPERVVVELRRIEDEALLLGAWPVVGSARYLSARAATERGDFSMAGRLLDGAAEAHLLAGDRLSASRTTLGRMHVLDSLGRHGEAIEIGAKALADIHPDVADAEGADFTVRRNEWRWLEAALHENMGIAQGFTGQHITAMDSYRSARRVYSELGADDDLMRLRANEGVELTQVGRFREAVSILAGVTEEFAAVEDLWWHGVAAGYLARAHLGMGSTERAVELAQRSSDVLESVGASAELLRARLVVSATLFATGRSEAGGQHAVSVLIAASRSNQPTERGQAWLLIGLALAKRGRIASAAKAFGRSIAVHEAAGQVRNAARSRLARAEISLEKAATFEDLSWVCAQLSEVTGPLERARAQLVVSHWVEPTTVKTTLEEGIELCGSDGPTQLLASLETELGQVLWREGETDHGEALLRNAADRELRRRRLLDVDQQWSASDDRRVGAQDALMAMLIARGDLDEAMRVAERTKAPALARRAMRESAAAPAEGVGVARAPNDVDVAISWREFADSIVGFASNSGSVVHFVELDRSDVVSATRRLANSVKRSILSGATAASGEDLHDCLTALGPATGAHELVSALAAAPGVAVSVSGDAAISEIPLATVGALRDLPAVVERPSLAFSSGGPLRRDSTLFVDCGGENLTWREAEREAVLSAAHNATACNDVSSFEQLAELIGSHDVIHIVGHGTAGTRRRKSALEFTGWSLCENDILRLPFAGRIVILNVCEASAVTRGHAHEVGGIATSALGSGAAAVLGSHWPVVDAPSAVDAALAVHKGISSGHSLIDVAALVRSEVREKHPHPLHWAGWAIRSLTPTDELTQKGPK